ncbi:methyltransferase [Streptomyces sp. LHD-70]|uniref:methyltransferase n=1 Tax=Streptomyces sp. LHD-70 TaxID=3072140 RepID=UPI00280ED74F|nr:methyltransferase [Streptomyces sp. LHD-70]MDQ8704559.1 methyltransferase [Streptomyces sp. LHD-70]
MTETERYAGDLDTSRSLRARLADELERQGAVRSPHWRAAVEAVPREVFLPSFFTDAPGPDGITRYTRVSRDSGEEEWLSLVYQDRTWVSQLDHGATTGAATGDGGEPVLGVPTSSSTAPSVVLRMFEDFDVPAGKRIYEAGSGTGYSTALACVRYGDACVTSTEHDPRLSALVGERLASLGQRPALLTGDAAEGSPAGAPYGGIIATYSPSGVPGEWVEQAETGGVILVSLGGGLDAYGYVRLVKTGNGRAEGRFLGGDVSFMRSRELTRPDIGPMMRSALASKDSARPVDVGVDPVVLESTGLMWSVQIALPGAVRVGLAAGEVSGPWFLHPDGSWAVLETPPGKAPRAYEGGPQRLWTRLEETASRWLADGRPGVERYGLTVTGGENTVWLDTPDRPLGALPAGPVG